MGHSSQNDRRVVITGLGVISSLGIGWQEFWKNLVAGKSGISRIEAFDTSKFDRHFAGEVKNFRSEQFFGNRSMVHIGRTSQFALAATKLALEDTHLTYKDLNNFRLGVAVGTTMGELKVLEVIDNVLITSGLNDIDPKMVPFYPSNGISATIARNLNITGDNFVNANACSAGNYSIGHSFDNIKLGKVDMMIAGGADSFVKFLLSGFTRLLAVATEKCQPFDKNRQGMLIGEGAGILVIEELGHAKRRGAPIYAEILNYGLSCDAEHMTAPEASGISKAINKALRSTGIRPEEVDYISAHGTGTEQNDKNEAQAVRKIFYSNGHRTPMSSIKSMLGHTMGAASAIEAIACCLAIRSSIIPPTINYSEPDEECDIDCVPNKSREKELNIVLNNSFAFGGNNACVVLRKNC